MDDKLSFEKIGALRDFFWVRLIDEPNALQRPMWYELWSGASWWHAVLTKDLKLSPLDALSREPREHMRLVRAWWYAQVND